MNRTKKIEELTEAMKTMAEALAQVAPALKTLTNLIDEAYWQIYRDAGMPYGETREGAMRWFDEQEDKPHD